MSDIKRYTARLGVLKKLRAPHEKRWDDAFMYVLPILNQKRGK
jgi:hypothetical protein